MPKLLSLLTILLLSANVFSQPLNYYQDAQNLTGNPLKSSLHEIINEHLEFQYSTVKQIIRQADEDPGNPNNLILIFTGWSIPKANFAVYLDSLDYWNREHIWAKSHGDFGTDPGPGTDVHALRPVDNSVNNAKSNKDYDNGGTQYFDAGVPTGCYTDADSWEPIDEHKGDVARMIFYMDARYEGTNGELNLTVVDQVNTYPNPTHGKLSTLLQWHQLDPVDDFERRRNDVIHSWQKNRNPFIDYPEYVNMIWGSAPANPINFNNAAMNPALPAPFDPVNFSILITSTAGNPTAILSWGLSWGAMTNTLPMTPSGNNFTITIPGQDAGTQVFFKIVANDGSNSNYTTGSYKVSNYPFSGTITPIPAIQGAGAATPLNGQVHSAAGIVTAAFGADFFIQSGTGPRSGLYIYNSGYFPQIGDSVIVTGKITEYYGKTEMIEISDYYFISSNNPIPDPQILTTGEALLEDWESVLVKVVNAQCLRDTAFGMWIVNDGTGDMLIHNSAIYTHPYAIGQFYDIIGVMNYDFDQFKIELRGPDDVEAGTDDVPPFIIEVSPINQTIVNVIFNEKISSEGVNVLTNYSINNGVNIGFAMLHAIDNRKIILTVSGMNGGDYTLTVNNLKDLSGNVAVNESFDFSYLSADDFHSNELQLFPNPAKESVEIQLPVNLGAASLKLYDVQGKICLSMPVAPGQQNLSVNLSSLKAGIYQISISSEQFQYMNKLIIY
jgi:endonuclease I